MMIKTIFIKTIFNLSKFLERLSVRLSVRFRAMPNKILMKTIPNILFSTKAPKILLGKTFKTVSYKLASPEGALNDVTSPSYPEILKTHPKNIAITTAKAVVNK